MSDYTYVGDELTLFAAARRWKAYLRRHLAPYLGSDVLEVGSGLGGTTQALCRGEQRRWVCLEPDRGLAGQLAEAIMASELPSCCLPVVGTLDDVGDLPPFDTLLYIDVLEHIEDDRAEVARAARHLKPGGYLVVLSPAHPFLFTPFDEAIGHFRRYTKKSLRALDPPGLVVERIRYLDSVGMLASLGNRLVLNRSMPTRNQVAFWDTYLVSLSRAFDPLTGYRLGKSVLGVWRKPGSA